MQILADTLKRPEEAQKILTELGERTDSSAPMVQLVQLELGRNNLEAAAAVIAKIRGRWKEAATGDILDGQLSLKRGNIPSAIEHFNDALKKDPENKIVQFWKAQLDGRTGAVSEAAQRSRTSFGTTPARKLIRASR